MFTYETILNYGLLYFMIGLLVSVVRIRSIGWMGLFACLGVPSIILTINSYVHTPTSDQAFILIMNWVLVIGLAWIFKKTKKKNG